MNQSMYQLGTNRSVIRDIFEYGNARRAQIGAENVFDFSLGNPNVPAPAKVNETIRELLNTKDDTFLHGYTSAQGAPATREAIAADLNARFGTGFQKDNFYITCGAAASLKIVITALFNEGDEFIAFTPFFPEYRVCYLYTPVLIIAVVTFGICMAGLRIGRVMGLRLAGRAIGCAP